MSSETQPKQKINVVNNKIQALEESVKSLNRRSSVITGLIVFGLFFILYDSWSFKNEMSKERFELLREQINNKNCIIK